MPDHVARDPAILDTINACTREIARAAGGDAPDIAALHTQLDVADAEAEALTDIHTATLVPVLLAGLRRGLAAGAGAALNDLALCTDLQIECFRHDAAAIASL